MKHIRKEFESRHVCLTMSTSGSWREWGLALNVHASWDGNIVREDDSRCTSTSLSVVLLWVRLAIYIYI